MKEMCSRFEFDFRNRHCAIGKENYVATCRIAEIKVEKITFYLILQFIISVCVSSMLNYLKRLRRKNCHKNICTSFSRIKMSSCLKNRNKHYLTLYRVNTSIISNNSLISNLFQIRIAHESIH